MFEINLSHTGEEYEKIRQWCMENLSFREGLVWQVQNDGWRGWGVHRGISAFGYTWSFTRQEDYTLFRLTWCYETQ